MLNRAKMCFKTYFCYQKFAKYRVKHSILLEKRNIIIQGKVKNCKKRAKLSQTQQEPEIFRLLLHCFCFYLEQICEDYSSSLRDSW